MEFVCLVKNENVRKAEEILKKDDVTSRLGITIRDAKAVGLHLNGTIFIIDGADEGVKRAKELIKDLIENAENKDLEIAKHRIKEEQDRAAEGFGGIFG